VVSGKRAGAVVRNERIGIGIRCRGCSSEATAVYRLTEYQERVVAEHQSGAAAHESSTLWTVQNDRRARIVANKYQK